jgi:hypothetical protein
MPDRLPLEASPGASRPGPLRLSIVIETMNAHRAGIEQLLAVLEGLSAQTAPPGTFEVLIVRDPLAVPPLQMRDHPRGVPFRVIDAPGAHYYAQKNRGVEAAQGEILAFLDSDCVPAPQWAAAILDAFDREGPGLTALQGAIWTDDTIQGKAFLITSFGRLQSRRTQPAEMLTGNSSAFRRSALLARPFDEAPVFHGPEVEMLQRLKDSGARVLYVPDAAVRHRHEPGLRNFLAFGAYWGWCFLSLRRHGSAAVPYRTLFNRLGPLAPLVLAPAKAYMDTRRLLHRRTDLSLSLREGLGCAAVLYLNALAVGVGGLLFVLGRKSWEPSY